CYSAAERILRPAARGPGQSPERRREHDLVDADRGAPRRVAPLIGCGRWLTECDDRPPKVRRASGMKKLLEVFLGVLTAIGGFVDIGELVANTEAGARYGLALAWPVLVGLLVIVLYAEMAGRIATLSQRPVFDLVRERMG